MYRTFILPASILAATIIGAGMFALPYTFAKAGLGTGFFYLALFGGIFSILHLMYAEIGYANEGHHRLVGHAEKYLGRGGRYITAITSTLGMVFTLTIYLVLSMSFGTLLAPQIPDYAILIAFWVLGSIVIFWEVNMLARVESLITFGIMLIITTIAIAGFGNAGSSGVQSFSQEMMMLPFGAVLFSLAGRVAIPALAGYFKNNNLDVKNVRPAIIGGTLTPVVLYALFVVGVIGLSGEVSEDAVRGISATLHPILVWLTGLLGMLAIWSSYIVVGRDFRKSLEYDFGVPKTFKAIAVVGLPMLLYIGGFQNFLALVALAGSIFVGIESMLTVMIWKKARAHYHGPRILPRIPALMQYAIILVFLSGVVYEIIK